MRLVAIGIAVLALAGCGAEDAAEEVRETVDPVAEAAATTAASGGARGEGDTS